MMFCANVSDLSRHDLAGYQFLCEVVEPVNELESGAVPSS
jgi:hypothetical protein